MKCSRIIVINSCDGTTLHGAGYVDIRHIVRVFDLGNIAVEPSAAKMLGQLFDAFLMTDLLLHFDMNWNAFWCFRYVKLSSIAVRANLLNLDVLI